jgi:hypothetical protein
MHIVLCNNRLIETSQLSSRMNSKFPNSNCVIFSSAPDAQIKSFSELLRYLMDNYLCTSYKIIACTNETRLNNFDELISYCSFNPIYQAIGIKSFYFWIDEADANIDILEPYIRNWLPNNDVVKFYFITATPERFFNYPGIFGDRLYIVSLSRTFADYYYKLSDCIFTILEFGQDNLIEAIEYILLSNPNKIQPGTFWFTPGKTKKSNHYEIKDVLVRYGFVVFTINGDGKQMWHNTENLPEFIFNSTEEVSEVLAKYYRDNRLDRYPFAITGNLCVGRGLSIQSEHLKFDYAILPELDNEDDAYQMGGRICGYRNNHNIVKLTEIFTTQAMKDILLSKELKATRIAEEAFRINGVENQPLGFTLDEFNNV